MKVKIQNFTRSNNVQVFDLNLLGFTLSCRQEEIARLSSLQPQVDLLEKRLKELKDEKEGEEDPSAFLDADITAFKEHYHQVLEDLRARERQLQLGENGKMGC